MSRNDLNDVLGFDITLKQELVRVFKTPKAGEALFALPSSLLVPLCSQFAHMLAHAAGIRELSLDPTIIPGCVADNTRYHRTQLDVPLHELPTTAKVQGVSVYLETLRKPISVDRALGFKDRTDPVTLLLYVSRFRKDLQRPVFTVWEDKRNNPCIVYVYVDQKEDEKLLTLVTQRYSRGRPGLGTNMLVSFDEISAGWQLLQFC
jgi:hypothetical protein